jgi:hypothetical protein
VLPRNRISSGGRRCLAGLEAGSRFKNSVAGARQGSGCAAFRCKG